jgi:acyl-coenzyme A thioesterase PaaI-like protein
MVRKMVDRDLAHFQSIPWCASLLNDPRYVVTPTHFREPTKTAQNTLFAGTLKTDQTFSAFLSLYKKPAGPSLLIEEVKSLIQIESGLNGHAHICHGGIAATILDEVTALLLVVNEGREDAVASMAAGRRPPVEGVAAFTAELVVKFLKPIVTPQAVCCVARFSEIDGRKIWLDGTIEDKSGTALATGRCLVVLKPVGML